MNWNGRHSVPLFVGVGCVALCLAASAPAADSPPSALVKLLPRAGEMPGFVARGAVHSSVTVAGAIAVDPTTLKKSDAVNLRKDGLRANVYQAEVSAKEGGIAGVTELRSPAAAAAYDKFTFVVSSEPGPVAGSSAQVRFVKFKIPGVPGGEGASQISRKKKGTDTNVQWTEGSCLIQVGDSTLTQTPNTVSLIRAAQAIYKRTKGSCTS